MTNNWTILVYAAGDNDLSSEAFKDIREMEKYGSKEGEVEIIALVDSLGEQAKIYKIIKDEKYDRFPPIISVPIKELGEINMGEASTLIDFIEYGISNYPADKYALIIWNHGSGWKEESFREYIKTLTTAKERGLLRDTLFFNKIFKKANRCIFRKSVEKIMASTLNKIEMTGNKDLLSRNLSKAIALDETNLDYLDTQELKSALSEGLKQTGLDSFSILGFDACLMANLELLHEFRDFAKNIVSSVEAEPPSGWPYHRVLEGMRIFENQNIPVEVFAKAITAAYEKHYSRWGSYHHALTLSAINTDNINDVAEKLNAFSRNLNRCIDEDIDKAFRKASYVRDFVTKFADKEYIDICHFAKLLTQEDSVHKPLPDHYRLRSLVIEDDDLKLSAYELIDAIKSKVILDDIALFYNKEEMDINGISLYLPESAQKYTKEYEKLELTKSYNEWYKFLTLLYPQIASLEEDK